VGVKKCPKLCDVIKDDPVGEENRQCLIRQAHKTCNLLEKPKFIVLPFSIIFAQMNDILVCPNVLGEMLLFVFPNFNFMQL
jgi:hypothetical protein